MSETKHTPGPWYIENDEYIATDEKFICALYFGTRLLGEPEYVEGQANANLIAAAPELLEALEELLDAWDGYELTAALDINLRSKVVSVIAKAKGEQ